MFTPENFEQKKDEFSRWRLAHPTKGRSYATFVEWAQQEENLSVWTMDEFDAYTDFTRACGMMGCLGGYTWLEWVWWENIPELPANQMEYPELFESFQ